MAQFELEPGSPMQIARLGEDLTPLPDGWTTVGYVTDDGIDFEQAQEPEGSGVVRTTSVRFHLEVQELERSFRELGQLLGRQWGEIFRQPPFRSRYATGPLSEYRNRAEHARARRLASWRRKRDIRMGRCPR